MKYVDHIKTRLTVGKTYFAYVPRDGDITGFVWVFTVMGHPFGDKEAKSMVIDVTVQYTIDGSDDAVMNFSRVVAPPLDDRSTYYELNDDEIRDMLMRVL